METVNYKNINFTTWDVGGRDKIVSMGTLSLRHMRTFIVKSLQSVQRPLWRHYFQNTDVLIFVADSNDRERMGECKDELWRFLGEDELKESILLVLANKQDLPNAMSTQELTEKLELNSIRNRDWCKLLFINLWRTE